MSLSKLVSSNRQWKILTKLFVIFSRNTWVLIAIGRLTHSNANMRLYTQQLRHKKEKSWREGMSMLNRFFPTTTKTDNGFENVESKIIKSSIYFCQLFPDSYIIIILFFKFLSYFCNEFLSRPLYEKKVDRIKNYYKK